MQKISCGLAGLTLALLSAGAASAQGTVKIGMINEYSGQFADTGNMIDNGLKLYMKQHGDTVAGRKIEVIRKDTGGMAPDVSKRLAQELVVRDNADVLGGFSLTPNALAAADVSAEAKKFMVVMNAATSIITTMNFFASAETSAAASAFGVSEKPPKMSALSRTTSSCARRLDTSGAMPPVSLRMTSIFLPATVSPCCFM